jgi:hypothetical protein
MKLLVPIFALLFLSGISFAQQTATDVTLTDCEGSQHNLFAELDAGKIIVVGWTMPCATCAGPLLEAHNAVLNFAISNPGVVEFWLNDDYGNSNCQTVQSWATNNGMSNAVYFADAALEMMDYGSNGMPKVVVLGCSDHKVYYNHNNNPSGTDVTTAINDALADMAGGCQPLSLDEVHANKISVSCYPNPASGVLNISVASVTNKDVTIEVVGLNGAVYKTATLNTANELQLDIEHLSNGMYFLKVKDGDSVVLQKFHVNQ